MSRIQNILDKAERDRALSGIRSLSDADEVGYDAALDGKPAFGERDFIEPASSSLTPGRIVRSARLDSLLVTALAPAASASEQYRALRMRISHTDHASHTHTILVTSPGRREGRTLTVANLGLAMAQDFQRRVCVVDADLRHPRLHRLFGVPEDPGLADVLTGQIALADALTQVEDQQITVLSAGTPSAHPSELLGSRAMRQTVETLREQFDRVIIDAPPTSPIADAGILAPLVDRVVLVVRAGVTTKPAIHEAVAAIGSTNLLGAILNDAAR